MVGPSGCGKTTTLRMIAGFERPTSGRIVLDGVDVAARAAAQAQRQHRLPELRALPAPRRRAATSPSGSSTSALTKEEQRQRVARCSSSSSSPGYERRKPSQLSGGQQQRVALARALVLTPRVLLLDEPLGALDARLRKDLQVELKTLQAELGITFVFVTHDQEEALTMSDRVAVMNGGRVEQAGTPREIYEEPATLFVADFLGVSNLIAGEAVRRRRRLRARGSASARCARAPARPTARGDVKAMIRPERVVVEPHGATGENRLPGMVEHAVFVGPAHGAARPDRRRRAAQGDDPERRIGAELPQGTPVDAPPAGGRAARADAGGRGGRAGRGEPAALETVDR